MSEHRNGLLGWLAEPDPAHGIHFAVPRGEWDYWTYPRLAELARQVGAGLVAAGVEPGDVVSLVQRGGPHFVATLFGAMLVGATPSPIAPPQTFSDRDAYAGHIVGLVRTARPKVVVTDEALAPTIAALVAPATVLATETLLAAGEASASPPNRDAPALLQFTSGSSGLARGVRIGFPALAANVAAIRGWLAMTPEDTTASWLPMHHDMGLIGCLITPVSIGGELWLLPPEEFIRNPLRYLRCFDAGGAVLTSMPNFGLGYVARRVRDEALDGLDFSAWRAIIVGAERIDPVVLERFHALLGPHGLHKRALLPAYGLAEGTLAVTGLPLAEEWTSTSLRAGTVPLGGAVELADPGQDGQDVSGCGRPLTGIEVAIHDEQGQPLPEGRIGEIVVGGACVASDYVSAGESTSLTALTDGAVHTADVGFLDDGQLFVLGRLGDSVKLRGRALFAEDLELAICQTGVPALRMAAVLGYQGNTATVVAVFEAPEPAWLAAADGLLRRRTEGADVVLVDAPRRSIPRTSSGKPRRRALWQAFVEQRLPGIVRTGADISTGGSDE